MFKSEEYRKLEIHRHIMKEWGVEDKREERKTQSGEDRAGGEGMKDQSDRGQCEPGQEHREAAAKK